jgi:hypothetical protein
MKKLLSLSLSALCMYSWTAGTVFAQASNGGWRTQPVVEVSYYRLPPGRQDEWLALYEKWHYPIMRWSKEHGLVTSETIYTRAYHELEPSWDICIVIVSPPPAQAKKPPLSRSQLIRKLFPNVDEYVKGEKARWSMTLAHWDERWVRVDIEKNPSLYYPNP